MAINRRPGKTPGPRWQREPGITGITMKRNVLDRARKRKTRNSNTDFARQKFCWIEQVARDDHSLPSLATATAVELLHHFNHRRGGAAWPLQATLAKALGVRREKINRALNALVERKHLTSTRRGREHPNHYKMVIHDVPDSA